MMPFSYVYSYNLFFFSSPISAIVKKHIKVKPRKSSKSKVLENDSGYDCIIIFLEKLNYSS